jgi:hypothetical protein
MGGSLAFRASRPIHARRVTVTPLLELFPARESYRGGSGTSRGGPIGSKLPMCALPPDRSCHVCSSTSRFPSWFLISRSTMAESFLRECSHREAAANGTQKGDQLAADSGCVHSHPAPAATEVPASCVSPVSPPSERKPWQQALEVSTHVGKRLPSTEGKTAGWQQSGRVSTFAPAQRGARTYLPSWRPINVPTVAESPSRECSREASAHIGAEKWPVWQQLVRVSTHASRLVPGTGHPIFYESFTCADATGSQDPAARPPEKCSRESSSAMVHALMSGAPDITSLPGTHAATYASEHVTLPSTGSRGHR